MRCSKRCHFGRVCLNPPMYLRGSGAAMAARTWHKEGGDAPAVRTTEGHVCIASHKVLWACRGIACRVCGPYQLRGDLVQAPKGTVRGLSPREFLDVSCKRASVSTAMPGVRKWPNVSLICSRAPYACVCLVCILASLYASVHAVSAFLRASAPRSKHHNRHATAWRMTHTARALSTSR